MNYYEPTSAWREYCCGFTLPAALILCPVTRSTRTFQGTFSAQEESPPTTFREILLGQEPTSLFPQMSCKAISTGRADAMRVARVTEIRDVMMTELCSHLTGAGGMFPSVVTASHWLVISSCEVTLDCSVPTESNILPVEMEDHNIVLFRDFMIITELSRNF